MSVSPADIKYVSLDKLVHEVLHKEELVPGHRGARGLRPKAAHRYHLGCGVTVDCPDDELDTPRFAQSAKVVDCMGCRVR